MKIYEGIIQVDITTVGDLNQLNEVRRKLDRNLAKIEAPPYGMVQKLCLKSVNQAKRQLRYELTIAPRTNETESRTIL